MTRDYESVRKTYTYELTPVRASTGKAFSMATDSAAMRLKSTP